MTLLEAAKNVVKQLESDSRHPGLELAYQELRGAIAAEPVPEPAALQETGDPWKDDSKVIDVTDPETRKAMKKAWGK